MKGVKGIARMMRPHRSHVEMTAERFTSTKDDVTTNNRPATSVVAITERRNRMR